MLLTRSISFLIFSLRDELADTVGLAGKGAEAPDEATVEEVREVKGDKSQVIIVVYKNHSGIMAR
ncbi:hypothetical protein, conserved [Babesia bigemina]|uniref:Uncharacterized protein n=1 Tax=Babesia bigemina TaxID=5866 RepID=A0A061BU06_BABBI|nr:hypothetical protein, conserved [Babesia bigemina]CDR71949.1 hypothetical protein, conserved [Babesia bigemina]|eukprot:XP_012770891.1 hypothetical protein, conserved [Babesia bigemina]